MSSLIQNIRIQDMIDILLNSYILFRFYVLFKGTQVLRVITGIALLWFFQRLGSAIGLIVTSWIMQGFMAIAAFVVIIVFRNEIRIVLKTRDWKGLIWGVPKKETNTPVELIVSSVYELSRKKRGALIVFLGKDDPEGIIQSGIYWGGVISKEMILSIFWNNNPVHDGAAIIQGNQIMKVGAILPLTLVEKLPPCYGTRHRAALGLAENSDALVIVVSEETGRVSVAQNCRIIEMLDDVELARILHNHLGIMPEKSSSLKSETLKLSVAALLSVLVITGIWYSFTRGEDTFMRKTPFHTLITKKIPVQVDWHGKLDDNVILESALPEPQEIIITGERNIIENISTLYTEKVSLYNIKQSGHITLSLAIKPSLLRLKFGSDKIAVSYVVKNRVQGEIGEK